MRDSTHRERFILFLIAFISHILFIEIRTCYAIEIIEEPTNLESQDKNVSTKEQGSEANNNPDGTYNSNDYSNKSIEQILRDNANEALKEGTNRTIDTIMETIFKSLTNSKQYQQGSQSQFEEKMGIEQASIQGSNPKYYIQSINARVTKLGFFESDFNPTNSLHKNQYQERFNKSVSRYIFWEIILDYPPPKERIDFDIESKWYDTNNNLIYSNTSSYFII